MSTIHPTAIIDSSANVAKTAVVGPYCVVGPDVTIGAGTVLHNHVVVHSLTTIGEDNEFFPFSVIGADPQDKKFRGERSTCEIGDRNQIREHVTIHRGTEMGGNVTSVGSDNLIMVAAHIAHDCRLGDEIVIANQVMIAGHAVIESGASIGGGAGVHHFATIGACAFVGGLARINKDVPPFMLVEGNPAEVRSCNVIAMSRRGFSDAEIEAIKDAYKRLYRTNGSPMSEKLDDLRNEYVGNRAIEMLCDHLEASATGVHGRALESSRLDRKWASRRPATAAAATAAAASVAD
ncbi:MAG: acyl-ACP--UDP-N-acetylglucosamine O-acyltransferase [Phycisphaerales bacterium]